jgi:phage baseplate assembly protein W
MAKYTDIDLYLTKNEITNDINLKLDIAAISQSIKNIILTTKGEKLFDPNFGGGAYDMVYESLSSLRQRLKESEIRAILTLYEPRASIQDINITDSGLGYWEIKITYSPVYDQSITRDITLTVGNDK